MLPCLMNHTWPPRLLAAASRLSHHPRPRHSALLQGRRWSRSRLSPLMPTRSCSRRTLGPTRSCFIALPTLHSIPRSSKIHRRLWTLRTVRASPGLAVAALSSPPRHASAGCAAFPCRSLWLPPRAGSPPPRDERSHASGHRALVPRAHLCRQRHPAQQPQRQARPAGAARRAAQALQRAASGVRPGRLSATSRRPLAAPQRAARPECARLLSAVRHLQALEVRAVCAAAHAAPGACSGSGRRRQPCEPAAARARTPRRHPRGFVRPGRFRLVVHPPAFLPRLPPERRHRSGAHPAPGLMAAAHRIDPARHTASRRFGCSAFRPGSRRVSARPARTRSSSSRRSPTRRASSSSSLSSSMPSRSRPR